MDNSNTISFYRERDEPYGCFSNFSWHPFILDGNEWKTVEHYFQAQKFTGTPMVELIRDCAKPMDAKLLGNSREYPIREDWEDVKDQIMVDAVYAKFATHEAIRKVLLDTGDAYIEEAARNDAYWGAGANGTGRNQLGKTLVLVRERLRSASNSNREFIRK